MDKLPINYKNVPKIILTALILEIVASLLFFMISKTWINQIIYVPLSQYVPISQYVPPMMKVNINHLLAHNNQMQVISPEIMVNKSELSKGANRKYQISAQHVYFPGDPLPKQQLDAIRNSSDTILKRRLTYKQYEVLRNMLAEIVRIFIKSDIRYKMMKWNLYKLFKC